MSTRPSHKITPNINSRERIIHNKPPTNTTTKPPARAIIGTGKQCRPMLHPHGPNERVVKTTTVKVRKS